TLSGRGVHVIDPFTGTGTFVVRLLQSGLIRPEDLLRKYTEELHANEIVLLAYYIAAVNIEAAFHQEYGRAGESAAGEGREYVPVEVIFLIMTYQISLINEIYPGSLLSGIICSESMTKVSLILYYFDKCTYLS